MSFAGRTDAALRRIDGLDGRISTRSYSRVHGRIVKRHRLLLLNHCRTSGSASAASKPLLKLGSPHPSCEPESMSQVHQGWCEGIDVERGRHIIRATVHDNQRRES